MVSCLLVTWVLATLALVVVGASYLLAALRAISRARDERTHYTTSARFWIGLAMFGLAIVVVLTGPIVSHELAGTEAGVLSIALAAVLPAVVVAAGLRNGFLLLRAARRRDRGLTAGGVVQAKVVSRSRWPLGQDLMALVVEADVPDAMPSSDMAYRTRRPDRTVRHRFVETCPGDHWGRFEPGATVTLQYDPENLGNYAVLIFG